MVFTHNATSIFFLPVHSFNANQGGHIIAMTVLEQCSPSTFGRQHNPARHCSMASLPHVQYHISMLNPLPSRSGSESGSLIALPP